MFKGGRKILAPPPVEHGAKRAVWELGDKKVKFSNYIAEQVSVVSFVMFRTQRLCFSYGT